MQSAIAALDLCALADAVAKGGVTSVKATTVARIGGGIAGTAWRAPCT
jgi:hypothetical protein